MAGTLRRFKASRARFPAAVGALAVPDEVVERARPQRPLDLLLATVVNDSG
jgi:hypothetical protein